MDPYLLLGVNRRSTIDEIANAFRAMMEKYSEDNYASGPMADLAAKKRKELEEAYDCIIKEKAQSQQSQQQQQTAQNQYTNYSGAGSANPVYSQVRSCIDSGNTAEATRLLSSVRVRDGEWYYLSGCVALRNGMYNEAYGYFKTATNKDPQNQEYRTAFMRMEQQSQNYRNYGNDMQSAQCCNCCGNLLLADCCCECMGGDLIPCC